MTVQRIALDVMGGDHAPDAILDGVLLATQSAPIGQDLIPSERILLVGDEARIRAYFAERKLECGFPIQHASEVIGMDESPALALRSKRDSSIGVAIGAVRQGAAGAMVSMGNTGACVGAATLMLKTLEGVRRPGIAVTMRLTGQPVTIMDMGANIACQPEHLLQYALMASVYMRQLLDVPNARVGLLNIGEEPSKGTDMLKEAYGLLKESPLNFVGNVEGSDLFRGTCDVLITDGFTGNVALKLMEGLSGFLLKLVAKGIAERQADFGRDLMASLQRQTDYSEYGGALLLGIRGIVVIGHGRSDGNAVANALRLADRAMAADVERHIVSGLAAQS